MANEPGYKWGSRNALKRADITTSVGQRLTEVRTRKGDKANAFGDDAAAQAAAREAKRLAAPATTKVARTSAGNIVTPEIAAARTAMDEARTGKQAGQAQIDKLNAFDRETSTAIAQAWMDGTPAFYASNFNVANLHHKMLEVLYTTQYPFGIPLFNACFKFLSENGYMEKKNRIRGEAAAKVYPRFDRETINAPTTVVQRNANIITPEERAALKALPLDQLAKLARANNRKS